jgi:hypothetical protein
MPNFPYTLTVYLESQRLDDDSENIDYESERLDNPNHTFDSLAELCQFLKNNVSHASESPLNGSITAWYIGGEYQDRDYFEESIHKYESYHLNGLDDQAKRQIARFMTAQNICN